MPFYNSKLLNEMVERDKCVILGGYDVNNLTCKSRIDFKCFCGKENNKCFEQIYKTGAFCMECIKKRSREKFRETNFERYGVLYPMQCKEIMEKSIQVTLEKYGVERPSQNTEIKNRMISTNMERYNVRSTLQNPETQAKIKKTLLERYNVDHPNKSKEIRAKIAQTNIERYGYANPMQNRTVYIKNAIRLTSFKPFKMPSGEVRYVQGYEPYALSILLNLGFAEDDILTQEDVLPIEWIDDEGKPRMHYPDIFIASDNTYIEVKSTYTFSFPKYQCFLRNLKKENFRYETWIFDEKKNLTIRN